MKTTVKCSGARLTAAEPPEVSNNQSHVTVETDAELASFLVMFNANGAVDLDDIHLSSLGHNVSGIAACQCTTTDLKSPRSAVIARQREANIKRKQSIQGNQL